MATPIYKIRLLHKDEIPVARQFRRYELTGRETPTDLPPDLIDERGSTIHVGAFYHGVMVGYVRLEQAPGSSEYFVSRMATAEAMRGKGIGAAVLRYAEQQAKAHGPVMIRLDARDTAVGFYTKMGYEPEAGRTAAKATDVAMKRVK